MKDVYVIHDTKNGQRKAKGRWTRIGVAFENKDGSLNVLIDAIPLNGRLHIRDRDDDSKQIEGRLPLRARATEAKSA